MKLISALVFFTAGIAFAAPEPNRYESLRQEIKQSIARGNAYLRSQQKPGSNWDDEGLPAFTALILTAAVRDAEMKDGSYPEYIEKGYQWLLAQQKEDGGIYNRGLTVYNTATSLTALIAARKEAFEPAIVRARKHLIINQWDIGVKGKTDDPNDGGIGYGSKPTHTDLSNTYFAIEALALSKKVIEDGKYGEQPDLDWEAAITFLSRCQNLKQTNDQPWASDDPKNKGGFIYNAFESKAGQEKLPDGSDSQRSYGSISYAGLLSLIYAKLSPEDPRVIGVKEWLGKNYTVNENPGMQAQGLYYYYQAMAKALSVANLSTLKLENGTEADWKKDLGDKLLSLQKADGSWVNANGKWMESNPLLVTAYTVLALEQIEASIP